LTVEQYLQGQGEDFEEMEEEGEEDQYGSEEGEDAEGGANKRAKNDEWMQSKTLIRANHKVTYYKYNKRVIKFDL